MSDSALSILLFTVAMALSSAALILVPGLLIAWLLARANFRGKSIVETIVSLPLVLPPVATGFALLKLFGRKGVLGGFLGKLANVEIVFTWKAVVLAMAVMSFPFLVRTARVGFEEVNVRLEQVARTLGAKRWRVFFTITMPLTQRAIIAGEALAFARSLGEFGATILVAGNIPGKTATLSVSIYQLIQLGKDLQAFHLAGLSLVPCFLALWLSEIYLHRKRRSA